MPVEILMWEPWRPESIEIRLVMVSDCEERGGAVTQISRQLSSKERRCILAHCLRRFSWWSLAPAPLGSIVRQQATVGVCIMGQNGPLHRHEVKTSGEKTRVPQSPSKVRSQWCIKGSHHLTVSALWGPAFSVQEPLGDSQDPLCNRGLTVPQESRVAALRLLGLDFSCSWRYQDPWGLAMSSDDPEQPSRETWPFPWSLELELFFLDFA